MVVLLSCIGHRRDSVFCILWTTESVLKYNAKENTIGTVEKIIVQQKFKGMDFWIDKISESTFSHIDQNIILENLNILETSRMYIIPARLNKV